MSTKSDPIIDAQSKQGLVVGVSVAFASFSALVVSLRLYTRIAILQTPGLDDWTILVAMIMSVGASVGTILEAHWGLGRHVWTLSEHELAEQMKVFFAVVLTYNFANNVTKTSFLLQFRRIFANPTVKRICLWLLGFVVTWAVVQCILLAVACVPVASIIPTMADKCLNTLPVWYFSSAVNIVTDFVIFIVPLPSVYRLKLRKQTKILVFSIFCLGFFVCIISIVRIFSLRTAAVTEDPTWDNTEAACWSLVELNCGILCASLPTIRPLLGKMIPSLATHRDSNYHMYGTGRDVHKTAASGKEVATGTSGSVGSTEALKEKERPSGQFDSVDYGMNAGRSNYVTSVCAGRGNETDTDVEMATNTPRTARDILVTTETVVRQDSGNNV